MDPPRFLSLNPPAESFGEKLKLAIYIYLFNGFLILTLVYLAYIFFDTTYFKSLIMKYANLEGYKIYFREFSFTNLLEHLWLYSFKESVAEEYIFRYPVLYLFLRANKKDGDPVKYMLFIVALALNLIWAFGFQKIGLGHPLPIPFIVGVPLYWLVIKTRSMWPAVICHTASNFGLYLLLKLLISTDFMSLMHILRSVSQ